MALITSGCVPLSGFEETKDYPIILNALIADRYQILDHLGAAR